MIDLRSDTVTQPTRAMRTAMAEAEVGDDVLGEDPTINKLQEMAAERMGKEAGLFVPSGTMGNLASALGHCGRGDEVIMGHLGHTFLYEGGGISALGGILVHTLPNLPDGTMEIEGLKAAIRADDIHQPASKLIIIENTHNRCGGVVLDAEYTEAVGRLAHERGLLLHLDGARIFNAATKLNITPAELAAPTDSVTFCLSKGLCAPAGSVICGRKEFIKKVLRIRKQLGGGMRQAGILAAAGIIALEQMTGRLGEDHDHARILAEGLAQNSKLVLTFGMPQTNMVFVNLADKVKASAAEIAEKLRAEDIRVGVVGPRNFRMVTHYWIKKTDVEKTIKAFSRVL